MGRPSKNTTSKKISPPTSKKGSTRSTTQHGIASLAETLVPMSLMKPNTSSTSTLARSQFYCSNLVNSTKKQNQSTKKNRQNKILKSPQNSTKSLSVLYTTSQFVF